MGPSPNEAVKLVLADVSRFVNLTLKGESLSKNAEAERFKLIEALEKLFADNYSLAPNSGDEGSTSSHNPPSMTGSLDESKNAGDGSRSEDDYDEHISPTNVRNLENPAKLGYLDYKKDLGLLSVWQKKRYIVLHKKILYCFKKPGDQKQSSAFIVAGYEFRESPQHVKDSKKKDCCFELVAPGRKSHQFLADSSEDLQKWKEVLQLAMQPTVEESPDDSEDLYEPLPEESSVKSAVDTPSLTIKTETVDECEEEIYEDGASEQQPVAGQVSSSSSLVVDNTSPTSPQLSPGGTKTGGGIFSKLQGLINKKKEAPYSDKATDTTEKKKEKDDGDAVNELEDVDETYEDISALVAASGLSHFKTSSLAAPSSSGEASIPPPATPSSPQSVSAAQQPEAETKKFEAAESSLMSASQPPPNAAPKLPSRSPVLPAPPLSPLPALPPRGPPGSSSQPPPLPDRELPLRPPPNIPVPPIPTSAKPVPKPEPLRPGLEKGLLVHPRAEDFENLYLGAWACEGATATELTFARGDVIHVISRDLEPFNWWVGELAGKIGLVPKSYLVPAFTEVH